MMLKKNQAPFWLLLLVSGCTVIPGKQEVPVPVEERTVPVDIQAVTPEYPVQTESGEKKRIVSETEESAHERHDISTPETGPAVIALLAEAEGHVMDGRSEQASASLERALRIEPKNALLWHRLAIIKMQQGQWEQAIALAGKSNALSGSDYKLQSGNWEVIAHAYEALGQNEMAKKAREKSINLKGRG
ncbi:MAG: hypothetical protein A2W28_01715 [Gammaproteobacteria bacterium RBG_16_51_14]|nr:MAG: hypothetical protein A2W28_01715 [Gammaproteobacteria bacterium RBG_16_51_14]